MLCDMIVRGVILWFSGDFDTPVFLLSLCDMYDLICLEIVICFVSYSHQPSERKRGRASPDSP